MKRPIAVILLLLGFGTSFAFASSLDCIPQSEMAVISENFKQFQYLADKEFCNDDSQTWHLLSSLMFMRQTRFSESMHPSQDEFFSGRFAGNWYEYFIGRINHIEVVSNCPKGTIAYVYMSGGSTMYACPLALSSQLSALDRTSVMMHEARHIDGFPHIECSRGPRKGLAGACDEAISDGGSYAVTVETYAQLSKYAEGLHPAIKAYARASAILYASETFDKPVRMQKTQKLMLFAGAGDQYLMNPKSLELEESGRLPLYGKVTLRGPHLILFPAQKELPAQFLFAQAEGTIAQSPPLFANDYNEQSVVERERFLDLHMATQWQARLEPRSVIMACNPKSDEKQTLPLPSGLSAQNFIYPNGYSRESSVGHVMTREGEVVEIGCRSLRAYIKKSSIKLDRAYTSLFQVSGDTFGVSEGSLYKVKGRRSELQRIGLEGSIFDMTFYENYNFFDAE
ncbi:hypothetical protein [Pseudobdellovibrio exovorus]|uniref:Uncharacterized protein n=1 Tax=Pseudobdellovibrio exovorus JSS TaxID=1184267 RepID=M4V9L6_9BACT|nr:hypothetical protein [Pseudobdellovibrio exovorus]AGH95908.1 hypothetical protein A11Q_1692 [Pseudobdellovibrio exovorus JSS]